MGKARNVPRRVFFSGMPVERAYPPLSAPHNQASMEGVPIMSINSFCAAAQVMHARSNHAPPTRSARTAHAASEICAASFSWVSMFVSVCMAYAGNYTLAITAGIRLVQHGQLSYTDFSKVVKRIR
jgi:hypothetical protein